jgi:hypothetical protein
MTKPRGNRVNELAEESYLLKDMKVGNPVN